MSDLSHLTAYFERFKNTRVLAVGDLMIDRFVYGRVDRVSPQAPIPVLSVENENVMLGGLGNVGRNVASLGAQITLVGVIGNDDAGKLAERLVNAEPLMTGRLVRVPDRKTTIKTRYIAGGQQLLRADEEQTDSLNPKSQNALIAAIKAELKNCDVILVSDYAKGCLDRKVIEQLIEAAHAAGKRVVVDPKRQDFSYYSGADIIKPNAGELARATGQACSTDDEVVAGARALATAHSFGAVLVTRDREGLTLVSENDPPLHFVSRAPEVFEVSGAGDTVLAVLGVGLAADMPLADAAMLANEAASYVVGKAGTAVVHQEELAGLLRAADIEDAERKVQSDKAILDSVHRWRAEGFRIGFTNGCFDLLHPGHVSLLRQAKTACDRLIVGLNSDASVKSIKGADRPIQNEVARAVVLASLADVDRVVLYSEDIPMKLIEAIRPDVLVKGEDYSVDQVVGADFVQSYGGKVLLAKIEPGHSTTATISRLAGTTA